MNTLIFGLVLFLGIHSVRIFSDDTRTRFIAKQGAGAWKGLYALISGLGFAAILWGFSEARLQPYVMWTPLPGMKHLAALLTLLAFILIVAAYAPGNAIKARVHHPMVMAVVVWSLAHLLANNTLADVVLFGSFLTWSTLSLRSSMARDRVAGTRYAPGRLVPTVITVVVGVAAWAVFAIWVHVAWIGIRPLG